MKYRTIKGVRFQEGVPKEWIESFLGKKELPEKFKYHANDDLCYLEHRAVGGSSANSLRPLTPYSILAKNRTVEQLAKGRNRQGSMWGSFVFDPADDFRPIYGGEDGGNLQLFIPELIRDIFFEKILTFKSGIIDPKYPSLICTFDKPVFNPKTGRIMLPHLVEMNHVALQKKFSSSIKMQEMLMNENNGIRSVIDSKGWRVDLLER